MTDLNIEQTIYLLHAMAYIEADKANTVTKGTVKSYLPIEWRGQAEKSYTVLEAQGLIKHISKGRFSLTEQGLESLVNGLSRADYTFTSVKGPKVLNALLTCLRKTLKTHLPAESLKEMSFDEFQGKFRALYFEERMKQELRGVVAIYSKEILAKFIDENKISQYLLSQYFEQLKSTSKILVVIERGNELMQWVE
jgi:hypothetical protein